MPRHRVRRRIAATLTLPLAAGAFVAAAHPAGALAAPTETVLAPVTSSAPPAVGVVSDAEGDAFYGAGSESYASVPGHDPVDLGDGFGQVLAMDDGWIFWGDSTGEHTQNVVTGATHDFTLASGARAEGILGDGRLIVQQAYDSTTHDAEIDLLNPDGTTTVVASTNTVQLVAADGDEAEVVTYGDTTGTWNIYHLDASGGTLAGALLGTVTSTMNYVRPFVTPTTYGYQVDATLTWFARGTTTGAQSLTLPTLHPGTTYDSPVQNGQTDGTTVTWVGADGLGTSPVSDPSQRTLVSHDYQPTLGGLTSRGLVYTGAAAPGSGTMDVVAETSPAHATVLDEFGTSEPVYDFALTAGRLVRYGDTVTSTAFANGSAGVSTVLAQGGDTDDAVLASGPFTMVDHAGFVAVYNGSSIVFSANATGVGLSSGVLDYVLPSGGFHVRTLSTGADTALPAGQWIGANGTLWNTKIGTSGNDIVLSRVSAATGAALPSVSISAIPSAAGGTQGCPDAGSSFGVLDASGPFVEIYCGSTPTVFDTRTLAHYALPTALTNSSLGDGIAAGIDQSSGCVELDAFAFGGSAHCVGTPGTGAPVYLDDTGGSLAWIDPDGNAHVLQVLGNVPAVGTPAYATSSVAGVPWTVSVPVDQPSSWTLTVAMPGGVVTSTGSSIGNVATGWNGRTAAGAVPATGQAAWLLSGTTTGGRTFSAGGLFTLTAAATSTPPTRVAPVVTAKPALPNLKPGLAKKGTTFTVSSAAVGKNGCVKVVVQRQQGKKWVAAGSSKCLSATKATKTVEKLARKGSYRIEVVWSLQAKPVKTWAVTVS